MDKGIPQPVKIHRYAGYGGDDENLSNSKTPTFYHSSDDKDEVAWYMRSHANDKELTWWDVVDRANGQEKIVKGWRKDYYDRAQQKWVKNYYWG